MITNTLYPSKYLNSNNKGKSQIFVKIFNIPTCKKNHKTRKKKKKMCLADNIYLETNSRMYIVV